MKNQLSLKIIFATMTLGALIWYFHIMELIGMSQYTELRLFNGVILFGGIFTYLYILTKRDGKSLSYAQKLLHGLSMAVITGIFFAIYFAIYMFGVNPDFYTTVVANEPLGDQIAPISVPFILLVECAASGLIFSFMSMQYLKIKRYTKSDVDHQIAMESK